VTVERETVVDGETETATYSGTQDNISDVIDEERDSSIFPIARNMTIYGHAWDLKGDSPFTIETPRESTDWDSETVEVAGETTVNDVSCTEFTPTPDISNGEEKQRTACLADGYSFAVSLSIESDKLDGVPLLEMTLTDATRP